MGGVLNIQFIYMWVMYNCKYVGKWYPVKFCILFIITYSSWTKNIVCFKMFLIFIVFFLFKLYSVWNKISRGKITPFYIIEFFWWNVNYFCKSVKKKMFYNIHIRIRYYIYIVPSIQINIMLMSRVQKMCLYLLETTTIATESRFF